MCDSLHLPHLNIYKNQVIMKNILFIMSMRIIKNVPNYFFFFDENV